MKLDDRIKLGMTVNEVTAILGKPSNESVDQNPFTLVFGDRRNGGLEGDFLEMVFYREKKSTDNRRLCMVMQMPQHETILK